MYEFAPAGDARQPREGIVAHYQHDGKTKPEEAIVHILHDVLQLPDGQAEDETRPAELIDLKANVTLLHCCNSQDEGSTVEQERKSGMKFGILQQIM